MKGYGFLKGQVTKVERANSLRIPGDVNGDDKVTIADVTALVNVILGQTVVLSLPA